MVGNDNEPRITASFLMRAFASGWQSSSSGQTGFVIVDTDHGRELLIFVNGVCVNTSQSMDWAVGRDEPWVKAELHQRGWHAVIRHDDIVNPGKRLPKPTCRRYRV
jgi:hypothetical protein